MQYSQFGKYLRYTHDGRDVTIGNIEAGEVVDERSLSSSYERLIRYRSTMRNIQRLQGRTGAEQLGDRVRGDLCISEVHFS